MGQFIPVKADKNILGVTIDRGWTYRQHTQDKKARAKIACDEGSVFNVVLVLKMVLDGAVQTICTFHSVLCQPTDLCITYSHRPYQVESHGMHAEKKSFL